MCFVLCWDHPAVGGGGSYCPSRAQTNCLGDQKAVELELPQERAGPGGCPPGITQPSVVPTAGAGAWPCAWQPGSHDERLGGVSAKPLKSSMGTSCYRLQWLPWPGLEPGKGGGFPAWAWQGPSLSWLPLDFDLHSSPHYPSNTHFSQRNPK